MKKLIVFGMMFYSIMRAQELGSLQEQVNSMGYMVKLNVLNTPRPQRDNSIDPQQVQRWISAHPTRKAREVAAAIIYNTQHISQAQFEASLGRVVTGFNSVFRDNQDYVILCEPGRSSKWVAELAIPNLAYLPNNVFPIFDGVLELPDLMIRSYRRFVMFDDCVYSGLQMSSRIQTIVSSFLASYINLSGLTIDIISPFITEFGMQRLLNAAQGYNFQLNLHTEQTLQSISSLLSDQDLDTVKRMIGGRHDRKTLIYFDHKVPDTMSAPEAFETGVVVDENGNSVISGFWFIKRELKIPFIPKTIPPYKQKQ